MELVKDTTMEVGYLLWQIRPPRPGLTLIAKATFSLVGGGPCMLAQEQQPVCGPTFYEDDPQQSLRLDSDFAVWKPRAECFLAGTCHVPGGRPAPSLAIKFQVGPVSKTLAIWGDRSWSRLGGMSAPQPFTSMPLRYERCFGGPDCDDNPLGRGMEGLLPNIEDPRHLITSPGSRPRPAGAFPIPPHWKSRLRRAGSYDEQWLAQRWPWFPEDFDGSFFNAAPEDQQIEGFWRGDEEIVLQNLHPQHPLLRTRLPGLRARGFLSMREGGFREVPLRLDTLTVDAEEGLVFALWRGLIEVETESLEEVDFLYLAHEPVGEPMPLEAHRARFEQRLAEREQEDEEFQPEPIPPPAVPMEFGAAPPASEAPEEPDPVEELEARLREALGPLEPKPELETPPAVQAATPAEAAAALRQVLAAHGMQPDEETEALLAELEASTQPDEEPSQPASEPNPRERLVQRLEAGESVAGEDWSEADLSGLDLRGVDLRGALLQGCSLREARLDEARLEGTNLSGSDLTGASLRAATLNGADLTGVRAASAHLEGAILEDALLSEGDFAEASFAKARCTRCELSQASLPWVDLRGACLDEAELTGARLEGARLEGASLQDAELADVEATGASFNGANLTRLRASPGARMARASFQRVQAADSLWGGALLDEADFSFSELARADFSGASLVRTCFNGCNVPHGRFAGARMAGASMLEANVFQGLFESADLSQADLRGANLYEAEFWKARTDSTRLELAILHRTKLAGGRS